MEKEINEFGDLLYSVLWSQKPKPFIKKLEKMIIEKKQFSFTKEEFINFYLLDSKRIGNSSEIDFFQLDFFNDSYDAVTFRTTDYSTVLLLRERITEFKKTILTP
tara:strand:+ start:1036 stop:1350 length:315 start_codon:yes stop_codon:yes gene_type:complete